MELNFFGNGSGFSNSHTNSYFIKDDTLYIIDCSLLNLEKIMQLNPQEYKRCVVILTHLHDDHASGLGLFIQKMFYVYNKKILLYAPENVLNDINLILDLTGVPDTLYVSIKQDELNLNSFQPIKTIHAPELDGKCYGYAFDLNSKKIVYSGDTCTLEPYKKIIFGSKNVEFYVDCSAFYGGVHLKYDDVEDELLKIAENSEVYVMHVDNEVEMERKIVDKPITLVKAKK